jgi:subtilase family serine protease
MRTKNCSMLITIAALGLFNLVAVLTTAEAQTGRHHLLTRHMHDVVSSHRAPVLGLKPETDQMDLIISLPLRNQQELDSLLNDLYDPNSPSYGQFLNVQEFTERFGPTETDYAAVVHFAEANGMAVTETSSNRLIVSVTGSVAAINKTFHIRLTEYQHPTESRSFFAPDREPTVDLGVPIWHVGGLDSFATPRPLYNISAATRVQSNATGSGPGGSFLGSDRRAAYASGTSFAGSGQSVGLFQLGGYNINDVLAYFTNVGQPLNVPINNVLLNGAGSGSLGDDTEQVIDIIDAVSMAPALSQVRVYIARGGSSFRSGVDDTAIFNMMATENVARQLSCSWAWKPPDAGSDDPIFLEFIAQGQSLFVASGDAGSYVTGDFVYPAEDGYITAVGGTILTTNGPGGTWASETAWPESGGGPAPDPVAIPSYQTLSGVINSSNHGSTSRRNVPDVAAEANTDNYFCANGSCGTGLGGTSLAAPTWAGLLALANQQAASVGKSPVGFINPVVYPIGVGSNYTLDFHDITSGSNGGFSAVSRYDLVTGWGSPNGVNMISALANYTRLATGLLGFTGQFACESDNNTICDTGTISVTVGNTTKTINYDGYGFFSGTGYGFFGDPGIPQTIVQTIANAFNNDPNSPVTATTFLDTYSNGYDVQFAAKISGPSGDYPMSLTVTSNYGSFQALGTATIAWTFTPFAPTGGVDPNTLTEISPITGSLAGGR